jgi:hypothetical protein
MHDDEDGRPEVQELFKRLKEELPTLEALVAKCRSTGCEDLVYRFYHQSFKVYRIQDVTAEVADKLRSLASGRPLNSWFEQILKEGTGKEFKLADNEDWLAVTRPMLEAFFHARYFLEMAAKYGREIESPPNLLPSGWAALLHLYNLR